MKRKPLLAGNWKMHTTVLDACHLAADIAKTCVGLEDRDVMLAPPCTVLSQVAHIVAGTGIFLAAQNVCWEAQGAFTGEISPLMVLDAGGSAAIVGHSERRQIFHEDNALINKRVRGALAFGLNTLLCVGETLVERDSGQTFKILEEQVRAGLIGVTATEMAAIILAYEPVWAIGTGKTASTEQAQEVHFFLRNLVAEMYEKDIADTLRILYGGSVKPDNIDALMAQVDIDGALVGGAALSAESFGRIINFQQI
jgi:triosephosphate isomerase